MHTSVQEKVIGHKAEKHAEEYLKKYPDQINMLESHSVLNKVRGVNQYDIYAVGRQLDAWEDYKTICEQDGSISHLGQLPQVAYDVITVAYGNSPLSAMASVQPIDEEKGIVYFKNVVAQTTRGNMTAGDKIFKPNDLQGTTAIQQFAGSFMRNEVLTTSVAGTTTYTGTVAWFPVRPEKVTISIPSITGSNGNPLTAHDHGNGVLVGFEIYGSVDYDTGAVQVDLPNDPGNGHDIYVSYDQDYEQSADIPKMIQKFDNTTVEAQIWALKNTMGLHQSFALRKRHGLVLEDEVSQDLVAALNSEIVNSAITKLLGAAVGNYNWQKAAPGGISYNEHKQSFKDAIAEAESNLLNAAGHGSINTMIVGRSAAAVIQTLPGFQKISDGASIGPHVWGLLDGITVIRAIHDAVLPADKVICMYKGPSSFESALVYAPYMPLMSTATLPHGLNPLQSQKAVCVWAALDILVKNFITTITIT